MDRVTRDNSDLTSKALLYAHLILFARFLPQLAANRVLTYPAMCRRHHLATITRWILPGRTTHRCCSRHVFYVSSWLLFASSSLRNVLDCIQKMPWRPLNPLYRSIMRWQKVPKRKPKPCLASIVRKDFAGQQLCYYSSFQADADYLQSN